MITKEIEIEELVNTYPFSVRYLMEQGIRCIACGEPIWGSLEEAAKEKNFDEVQIQHFVDELNKMAKKEVSKTNPESTTKIDIKPLEN